MDRWISEEKRDRQKTRDKQKDEDELSSGFTTDEEVVEFYSNYDEVDVDIDVDNYFKAVNK